MLIRGKKAKKNPHIYTFMTFGKLMRIVMMKKLITITSVTVPLINKLKVIQIKDVASNFQFGFQEPASTTFECIIDLHHDIMLF
jgi:hypothetical protein